ncbi:MAG: beta-galactosidase, partial [Spirochaetales bacterium]|nr:beta-galactosidase [Spirochaetales bacterium]
MYFGADYYPEHWDEDRWAIDARLMKDAGFNLIRVAEFAWAKIESEEGKYDFSWLDAALDVFDKEGIKVVMGTPTATPPKWLMDKHSDIYKQDYDGNTLGFGSRRHYCYNSEIYRDLSCKITEKVVQHYSNNSAVVAWQIDNEFTCGDGLYCYCEDCRRAFINWCKNKYGSLDSLNKAWGTVFWSQTYTDWEQLIVPKKTQAAMFGNNGHNPGLNLDYSRFQSDAIISYCSLMSETIRKYSDKPITHNIVSELYDYYKMADNVDICTYDNYPASPWGEFLGSSAYDPAFSIDIERGIKNKNIWVIEQQSGPCGWDVLGRTPKPGQLKTWTYQALAHGAEAIVYFRWRACLFGTEEYWYGILDHDGIPRRRYNEIKEIGELRDKLDKLFVGSKVQSDILMIRSFEQQWSHSFQSHSWNFKYRDYLHSLYNGFFSKNYNIDITNEDADFGKYNIVVAPAFNLMNSELQAKFENYVKNGG